jgi:hypothetical protein
VSRDAAVADRVDAAMDRVQTGGGEPMSNRSAAEAERQQLAPGYHTVLAPRHLRDHPLSAT